jgi:purine-binding chemotaxis protein CheW
MNETERSGSRSGQGLVIAAGASTCVIPLEYLVETMRPLPVAPLRGAAQFIKGVSIIRGAPVPVVDLGAILTGHDTVECQRVVTIKLGERRAALAVERVIGVRDLATIPSGQLPPLLRNVATELIEAIGAADEQLLIMLRVTRVIPEEVWATLAASSAAGAA